MKKLLQITFAIMLGMGNLVSAQQVDIAKARLVAENFYQENTVNKANQLFNGPLVSGEFIEYVNEVPVYFVFNFNNSGFVVVAAHETVHPVIAYSDESTWNSAHKPANVDFWMEQVRKLIGESLSAKSPADERISASWAYYAREGGPFINKGSKEKDVPALLSSKWNQDFPYNGMCPADPASTSSMLGKVPTGCGATALASIMHYWRHPAVGEGNHCITPQPSYGPQCANFQATNYNWLGMPDQPTSENPAIALLLWHVGIAVNMNYGPNGSGSTQDSYDNALENYFRYSDDCLDAGRSNYSTTAWLNLLKSNLDDGKPMVYSGSGGSGAHAWVCDGYVGNDYFHMNWGWGGQFDGYFYLNDLSPGSFSFNNTQEAIVNIAPDSTQYPLYCDGQVNILTDNAGSIEDGSGPVKDYLNNANCSWLIQPDDSMKWIELSFIRLNLDLGDKLIIYDGNSSSANVIGDFTGTYIPPSFTTFGPEVFISFTSDQSWGANGFLLEYNCVPYDFCEMTSSITDASGIIKDGSNDFQYRNSSYCKWYIAPMGANAITLSFNSFNTEAGQDILEIHDYQNNLLLAQYSGDYSTPPPLVISYSGFMSLTWTTNHAIRGEGWEAEFFVGVGVDEQDGPARGILLENHPNPFMNETSIEYEIFKPGNIEILIFNYQGKEVERHNKGQQFQGKQRFLWDTTHLPDGIYLINVVSGKSVATSKAVKISR